MVEKYKLTMAECEMRGGHDYESSILNPHRSGEIATKKKPDYYICKYCVHTQIRYYTEHREGKLK